MILFLGQQIFSCNSFDLLLTLGVHEATTPKSRKSTSVSIQGKDHSPRKNTRSTTGTNAIGLKEPIAEIRRDAKGVEANIGTKNLDKEVLKTNTRRSLSKSNKDASKLFKMI